jgi:hypothetical protein
MLLFKTEESSRGTPWGMDQILIMTDGTTRRRAYLRGRPVSRLSVEDAGSGGVDAGTDRHPVKVEMKTRTEKACTGGLRDGPRDQHADKHQKGRCQ